MAGLTAAVAAAAVLLASCASTAPETVERALPGQVGPRQTAPVPPAEAPLPTTAATTVGSGPRLRPSHARARDHGGAAGQPR
jgi:hypothetical protein